jgi:exosortase
MLLRLSGSKEGLSLFGKLTDLVRSRVGSFLALSTVGLLALLWANWTTLGECAQRWSTDPSYSHGWLVPIFAGVLLWLRRRQLAEVEASPRLWNILGLLLLSGGILSRLAGAWFHYASLDAISLLPCVAGLLVLLGGWPAFKWSWPAVAFLAFMIPLPYRVSVTLAEPLQGFATVASTFCLQTLGLPAIANGNVILLNDHEIGIVEACSGLRMLVIFFALATGMCLLIKRPAWEKAIIIGSAVPIALLVNLIRITVTGVMFEVASDEWAHAVFHDLAGWLMMPLALVLLSLELLVLKNLFLEPATTAPPKMVSSHRQPPPPRSPNGRPRQEQTRRPAIPVVPRRRAGMA